MPKRNDIVIGIFYGDPSGKIARTTGWDGRRREVRYHFDDGRGGRTVAEGEFSAWKARPDLADFPDARDPRLPYVFDLFWDAKYRSQLADLLRSASESDIREIRAAMAEHGIVLDDVETSDIEPAPPAPGP